MAEPRPGHDLDVDQAEVTAAGRRRWPWSGARRASDSADQSRPVRTQRATIKREERLAVQP